MPRILVVLRMIIFIIIILSIFVGRIFYLFCFISSYKVKHRNKISSFECGFMAVGSLTRRFSIHFFILVVIFIIFELEIVLLVGCLYSTGLYSFIFVILFILGGIYLEYSLGKLRWIV
jgi:NADH:ubiquinone oxidoreductase subunit 3 (subunit A)